MKCEVCGNEYGHGKGFHGTRYKTIHFCSEECYNNFLISKIRLPKEKQKSNPVPSITCICCGKKFIKGTNYKGEKYKNLKFCSKDCYDKFIKMKSAPKSPVNYKPEKGSERRKFTDYIQSWVGNINWAYIMKQAKDIQEEYKLDWTTMYKVLKYCREYEELEWNLEYGLYQFFPKYIKLMQDFSQAILQNKNNDFIEEDEIIYIHKSKSLIGKVEF